MVAQSPASARTVFNLAQLAKVEFFSAAAATANIAVAGAVDDGKAKGKHPLLITGIPIEAAASLTPAKLAAGDRVVFCTITLASAPVRSDTDIFFTAAYGGRLILES